MAFPLIIMALAMVSIFGTGVHNVIVAITIPLIPRCARVVRSSALSIREVPYVDAARACGFGHSRIILRHMVPNVMAPFHFWSPTSCALTPGRGADNCALFRSRLWPVASRAHVIHPSSTDD
jgi:ABC-type dipeptide/oligopeptide/nickel transport system permease subunit